MTPENWEQIDRLLEAALQREPEQRLAFLTQACAGDEILLRDVEALISSHKQAGDFLEAPPAEIAREVLEDQAGLKMGALVGPYKILGALGAGGMGEVYIAQDTRLDRKVAIKVLPMHLSADPDRLRRFEQEARATGSLNHPNILAIYDVGTHEGSPYVVSELLEGETLSGRLADTHLSSRKAVDWALQIAHGLAAAHEKGIIHRDLKPENLFLTRDGHLKILDFGIAKLTQTEPRTGSQGDGTISSHTDSGVILGTAGYMSPEQVRGQPVDHRSDIFSFGTILYEMLSGKKAFHSASGVEMMNAILKDDPPELCDTTDKIPPALGRVVRRCLEKRPEERFQSARDLAFALEALSGFPAPLPPAPHKRWSAQLILTTAMILTVTAIGAFWAGQRTARTTSASPPTFRQLTFRQGFIPGARFAPDGQTIIYAAAWDGKPVELFTTRLDGPESRPLGLSSAGILAISSSGQMAVVLRCEINWGECRGTLAQVPLLGGDPREVLEEVDRADYGPDGKLAVVRVHEGRYRLEYPIGKVLYEARGWIGDARFSPKGDQIAFFDRPRLGSDSASVSIVDLAGNYRSLSPVLKRAAGLAWSPSGDEIWFTAELTLRAVTPSGKQRVIFPLPGGVRLLDISRQGRLLLERGTFLSKMIYLAPGATKQKDLSWFDWSTAADLSPDWKTILFSEWGRATGRLSTVYLRRTDRPEPVRLGEGRALALSPDAKWALVLQEGSPQLVLLPTAAGQPRLLTNHMIEEYQPPAIWLPDGRRIVFAGLEKGGALRSYIQDIEGGKPRPLTNEGTVVLLVAPDGKQVVALGPDGQYYRATLEPGEPAPIRGLQVGDTPIQWSADGRALYVRAPGDFVAAVYRIDLATGRRELWKELAPIDPTGVMGLESEPRGVLVTPDGKAFVYSY